MMSGNSSFVTQWMKRVLFCKCINFGGLQEEDGTGGDQDQEERRWNKRTQQMLHGLQVHMIICFLLK